MAIMELIFRRTPVSITTVGAVAGVTIDATISEEHSSEADVTEHPVEQGSAITDHIRAKPRRLTLNGVISDTPLTALNFDPGTTDRPVQAWQELKRIQEQAELVDVVTSLESYYNMALESLSCTRDAQKGQALHFTASLREVIKADAQTVAAPTSPAAKPKALGKQPTPPVSEAIRQSMLSKGFGFLGIF
jgi:hypothetical protein